MGKIIRNGEEYSGACEDATAVNYNNSLSGLNAQTVQEAIDELSGVGEDGNGMTIHEKLDYIINNASNPYLDKYIYIMGDEIHSLSRITSHDMLDISEDVLLENGTATKNTNNLYFGDLYGDYAVGGFVTDDYIDLNHKQSITFNGTWSKGSGSLTGSTFDVNLIDVNNNVYKVHNQIDCNVTGEITVSISSYNEKYKIAFFHYCTVRPQDTATATVNLIRINA